MIINTFDNRILVLTEAFSFIAFALALVYLFLEWWMKDKATGVFLLAPPLFFQIVSSAFITHISLVYGPPVPGAIELPLLAAVS